MEQIIGYIAAVCTTVSFIPQVLMVIKTKNTQGISLGMYVVFCLGLGFWLTYGIMKNDTAIILANAVTLTLASVVLISVIKAKLQR